MGYELSWCIDLLDDLEQKGCLNEPMAQLGDQEFFGNKEEIKQYAIDNNYKNLSKEITPKNLFKDRYDIEKYDDFDINGKAKYIIDMRSNLLSKFKNKYQTVMDIGTSEHIFNTGANFKNIYDMCDIGGVVIHSLPIHHWGHGWFNFTERTFRNLCIINKYEMLHKSHVYKAPDDKYRYYRDPIEWDFNGGELYYVTAIKKTQYKFETPRPLM